MSSKTPHAVQRRKRPVVIAFSGYMGTGKSTSIRDLSGRLQNDGLTHVVLRGRALYPSYYRPGRLWKKKARGNTDYQRFINILNKSLQIVRKSACNTQMKYDINRKIEYDKKLKILEYKIGDLVIIDVSKRGVGNVRKFNTAYVGPYKISKILSPNSYEIMDPNDNSRRNTFNIRYIKKYNLADNEQMNKLHSYDWIDVFLLGKQKRKRTAERKAASDDSA